MGRLRSFGGRWSAEDEDAFSRAMTALNMHRCLLAGLAGGAIAVWSSSVLWYFSEWRMDDLRAWTTTCVGVYVLLLAPWRWIARPATPENVRRIYVLLFAAALIGICDGFFLVFAERLAFVSSFSRGMLVAAVIFVLPLRRLAPLIVANEALLCGWLVRQGVSEATLPAFFDGTVGAIISVVVSQMFYRAKRADFSQQRQIERQGAEMNELMAITAHDLRSPLIGLKNLLALAPKRLELSRERLAEVMAEGERACERMLGLIGRLLEAHLAETGASDEGRSAELRAIVREASERCRAVAEAKNVRLETWLPEAPVKATVDTSGLARVLDNLLGNALKFSPRGGSVHVVLSSDGERWRIGVRDDGPGVPAGERERLFRKYGRGSALATGGEASSGLGLYIARTLAERMGATVTYVARPEGGSEFSVEGAKAADGV